MTFGHPPESELEWFSRYNAQLNQLPAQFAAARRWLLAKLNALLQAADLRPIN